MDAVRIRVVTLGEDHSKEGPVELHADPHVGLLALNLDVEQVWSLTQYIVNFLQSRIDVKKFVFNKRIKVHQLFLVVSWDHRA